MGYSYKEQLYLIPSEYVTPFNGNQIRSIMAGRANKELEDRLQQAYCVHSFLRESK